MIVLPAIDLYGGEVVRLRKGDFDQKSTYGANPIEVARGFRDLGCGDIHIVDLEGAECGSPRHLGVLAEIRALGMRVEYGGGLRTMEAVKDAIDAGADRAMVGSLLFKGEEMPDTLFAAFGTAITPSLDVRGNRVVVAGWREETQADPVECLARLHGVGFRMFLVTAVERDGMLAGPDLDLYGRVAYPGASVIAAGGVSTVDDVKRLAEIGVYAAVVGKALYEGYFDLRAALAAAGNGGTTA